ncbi:MAG: putative peptidoglycan-binding domain-containing protein [Paracoccus sp. (in: a-proteobacteria)]|nr:putative peptidoglycan-binding domain-containing protein [Paracoccus sp. (in: a-proteobacteria)]
MNSGVGRGARWLQRAVGMAGADVDGMIGSKTLSAVRSRDSVSVIKAICATRMGFLRGLGTWTTFGRGWSRRVASIEARGVQMAGGNIRQEQAQAAAAAQREETAGAGSGAVGAGTAITDLTMPYDLIQWLLVGLLLAAAAVLIARSRHDRNRAAAYAAVTTEG